ncbi:hypothetical protein CCM_06715 [Cordyceps militaris CM01]|uniref:Uncharacterized protein n=1 Tax=Cordyceps militaris (strain CM01) TaxID=983644 RepID=G3JNB6_CORMM|nr:uncharacterized protein CCM_06715 [Cordyceps militaris CM01]EGX90298.1 hypothetical protein CCM_06715 [Cordyceps militaris CM01]
MAAPKPRDPLDALQGLLNDVLVQTGKALRASRRDSQGNLALPQGISQSKLPQTIDTFHKALDDLEGDIMKAKSVILRDLNQLQADQSTAQQQQLQPALAIESLTKEPMPIDIESSPPPSIVAHTKPVLAPFPVMDPGNITNGDTAIKTEDHAHFTNSPTKNGIVKLEAPAAPEAPMMADSNFTDMQFSLAPGDGLQGQNTTAAGSFDVSSFAPSDTMLSLNNMLPGNSHSSGASSTHGPAAITATTEAIKTEPLKDNGNANESNFEEFFTNDASQADGMDFDFSLGGSGGGGGGGGSGGGMGEDTFDDLMNDRDGTFDLMSNEDFDAAFFSLDNKDGTT